MKKNLEIHELRGLEKWQDIKSPSQIQYQYRRDGERKL